MGSAICFCNRKGGSGKTTTAVHVSAGLSILGKRVLLVDSDPQGHSTLWLQGGVAEEEGLCGALYAKAHATDYIVETGINGLYLLPSHRGLGSFETEFSSRPGSAHILKDALAGCRQEFDCIVFDTPPYLGLLLLSVLTAADSVFVTLPLQFLALEGLQEIIGLVEKIKTKANKGLRLEGIIPVMLNRNLLSSHKLLRRIRREHGHIALYPYIRQNIRLAEAPEARKLVYDYAPSSYGACDYWNLVKAIDSHETRRND